MDSVEVPRNWINESRCQVSELNDGFVEQVSVKIPIDAQERKGIPIVTGVLDYFPLALAEVSKVSKAGNDQHNPGEPMHWSKDKSTDHADCIGRHLIDRGGRDVDGQLHSAKLAWRALAQLEIELEEKENVSRDNQSNTTGRKEMDSRVRIPDTGREDSDCPNPGTCAICSERGFRSACRRVWPISTRNDDQGDGYKGQ